MVWDVKKMAASPARPGRRDSTLYLWTIIAKKDIGSGIS